MKKMLCLVLLALFMDVQVKAAPEALDTLNINLNMMDQEPVKPPIGPLTEEGDENAEPDSRPGAMEHMESYPEPEPNKDWHLNPEPNEDWLPRDNTETIVWEKGMEPVELRVQEGTDIVFEYHNEKYNVKELFTKKDFDECDNFPSNRSAEQGPITKRPIEGETHFFACTIEDYCKNGMKAQVTVVPKIEIIDWKLDMEPVELTVTYDTRVVFLYNNLEQKPGEEKAVHNVQHHALASKEDFDACNFDPGEPVQGPITFTYTNIYKGTHYYTCTVGDHCKKRNMKATINVLGENDGVGEVAKGGGQVEGAEGEGAVEEEEGEGAAKKEDAAGEGKVEEGEAGEGEAGEGEAGEGAAEEGEAGEGAAGEAEEEEEEAAADKTISVSLGHHLLKNEQWHATVSFSGLQSNGTPVPSPCPPLVFPELHLGNSDATTKEFCLVSKVSVYHLHEEQPVYCHPFFQLGPGTELTLFLVFPSKPGECEVLSVRREGEEQE